MHWGKYMTILCAFVLLLPNLKLSHTTKAKCWRLSSTAGHSNLFSFSRWHSPMHTVFYKFNLFWARIQPALLRHVAGACVVTWHEGYSCPASGEVVILALGDSSRFAIRAARCQPQLYQQPLHKGQLLALSISPGRFILNTMSFLQFWIR